VPLFIISLIAALALAIPTCGISLVVFVVVKYAVDIAGVNKLLAATQTSLNTDDQVLIGHVNNAAIRNFFEKHGTTAVKCVRHEKPFIFYIGYVTAVSGAECVSLVGRGNGVMFVSAMEPPVQFGEDMLSLMGKKQFIDEIVTGLNAASR